VLLAPDPVLIIGINLNMDKVITPQAVIYINEGKIIHVKTLDTASIGVDEATDTLTIAKHFVLDEPKLILVDLRRCKKITAKSKTLFKKSSCTERYKAKAIVISSKLICKIKNIYYIG
jgi:hypothetical protein